MTARNVLGTELLPCSYDPLTGFYRDGCCNTDAQDAGTHVVCARMTREFLDFSLAQGNDLITPRPEYRFAAATDTPLDLVVPQYSLRGAISLANANRTQAYTLTLPDGTYPIFLPGASEDGNATGDLDILGQVTLSGSSAQVFINGVYIDRLLHIRQNLRLRPHALVPAGVRHDAEGAVVVAALDDGHIRLHRVLPPRNPEGKGHIVIRVHVDLARPGPKRLIEQHRQPALPSRRSATELSSCPAGLTPAQEAWLATESAGIGLGHAVVLLAAAVIAVPLFRKLGLGAVLGYLCAGLLIGPFGLAFFHDPQAILHVAELGVVLFLFLIGLEMRPTKLWALRKEIFGLGLAQVLVCGTLLTGVGLAFGWPPAVAVIGAMGFVLSSTAVIMKMLDERGVTASPAGQRAVSILLLEDLSIIPLLALVALGVWLLPVLEPATGGLVIGAVAGTGGWFGLNLVPIPPEV